MTKRILALPLSLALAFSLAACGGGDPAAQNSQPVQSSAPPAETTPVESPLPEETVPPQESEPPQETEPVSAFTPVASGETISLDFVDIAIGELGSGEKMTEGNISYSSANDNVVYFWLNAVLTNTSGQALELYNMKTNLIFDDKYTYEGDVRCFAGSDMDPLVENRIYLYAEIAPVLQESWQTVTIQFAFNEGFGEYDYAANNYEQALENYDYAYEVTFTNTAASGAAAEG